MDFSEIPDSLEDKEVLDCIVWNYLRDVDTELASKFRRLSKAKSLGKNVVPLAKLYQHYKNTVPENERVRNKVKRQHPDLLQMQNKESAESSAHAATPDVLLDVNGNSKVKNEIIDLTDIDFEAPQPKIRKSNNEKSSNSSDNANGSTSFESTSKQFIKSMKYGPSTSKATVSDISSHNLQNVDYAEATSESQKYKFETCEDQQSIRNVSLDELITNLKAIPDEKLQLCKERLENDPANTSSVALQALADIQEANKLQTKILEGLVQYAKQLHVLDSGQVASSISLPQSTNDLLNDNNKISELKPDEIKSEDEERDKVNSPQSNNAGISESSTNLHNNNATMPDAAITKMKTTLWDINPEELISQIIIEHTDTAVQVNTNTNELNDTKVLIAPNIIMAINNGNVVTFKSADNKRNTRNSVTTEATNTHPSNNIVTKNSLTDHHYFKSVMTAGGADVEGMYSNRSKSNVGLQSPTPMTTKRKQTSTPVDNAKTARRVLTNKDDTVTTRATSNKATALIPPQAECSSNSIALTSKQSPSRAINIGDSANTQTETNIHSASSSVKAKTQVASMPQNAATTVTSNSNNVNSSTGIMSQPTTYAMNTKEYHNGNNLQNVSASTLIPRNPHSSSILGNESEVMRLPLNSDGMSNRATQVLRPATLVVPNKCPLKKSTQNFLNEIITVNSNAKCTIITNPPSTPDHQNNASQIAGQNKINVQVQKRPMSDAPNLVQATDQMIKGVGCLCCNAQPGPSTRQQPDQVSAMQSLNLQFTPQIMPPPFQSVPNTIKVRPDSFLLRPPRFIPNSVDNNTPHTTDTQPTLNIPKASFEKIKHEIAKEMNAQVYTNPNFKLVVNLYSFQIANANSIENVIFLMKSTLRELAFKRRGIPVVQNDFDNIRSIAKLHKNLCVSIAKYKPMNINQRKNVRVNPLLQRNNAMQEQNLHQQNPVQLQQNLVQLQQNPVLPQQNPVQLQQNPVLPQQNPVQLQQNPVIPQQNPVLLQQNPVQPRIVPIIQIQQNPDPLPLNLVYKKQIINENHTDSNKSEHYKELLELEEQQLIPNIDAFTCEVCLTDCEAGQGVMLHNCLHCYCKECLGNLIRTCEEAQVKCPYRSETDLAPCDEELLEREVRALVSDRDYEKHLARGLRLAESRMEDAFHCQTVDCPGWCVHDVNVTVFKCPRCGVVNCLQCKAIHMNESCTQYQGRLRLEADFGMSNDDQKTKATIEKLLQKGDAMRCPRCHIVVTKEKASCDWVKCGSCHTELCWATKGPRWGPNGHGDTSGGCRCKLGGRKCHPNCKNCH